MELEGFITGIDHGDEITTLHISYEPRNEGDDGRIPLRVPTNQTNTKLLTRKNSSSHANLSVNHLPIRDKDDVDYITTRENEIIYPIN